MTLLRRLVQMVFLGVFVVFLVLAARPVPPLPLKGFLLTSPFAGLLALLGGVVGRWMLVGAALVVLTALFGRFFCGWVCPMGTTIDLGEGFLRWGLRLRGAGRTGPRLRRVKYYLLLVALVAAGLGSGVGGWLDPISLATRSYTLVVYPVWSEIVVRAVERVSPSEPTTPWAETPVGWLERNRIVADEVVDVSGRGRRPTYRGAWLAAGSLLIILSLGLYQRRFWCRNLCPLGALLAIAARLSRLGVRVGRGCSSCRACLNRCKMGALEDKPTPQANTSECILCWSCTGFCPEGAIGIGLRLRRGIGEGKATLPGRRGFIKAVVGTVLLWPILRMGLRGRARTTPLRPPGARRPEEEFLALCIRCGECVKVCPQNALQPALLEYGLEALSTPVLAPRVGYCAYECSQDRRLAANLCGQLCPTGAIEPLSHQEKTRWRIGTALIDRSRCIPWREYRNCGVCEEHCPVPGKAILFVERRVDAANLPNPPTTVKLPHVLPERCIGCGICEYVCPVEGEAAIRVGPPQREEGISR